MIKKLKISFEKFQNIKKRASKLQNLSNDSSLNSNENLDNLQELVIEENNDILLKNDSISNELKRKYYDKQLTIEDVLENMDLFSSIPVEFFLEEKLSVPTQKLSEIIGSDNFLELLKKYPQAVSYLLKDMSENDFSTFLSLLKEESGTLDEKFLHAVKKYIFKTKNSYLLYRNYFDDSMNWLFSLNFTFVSELMNFEQLMKYDDYTILMNPIQREVIDTLNIKNIKKLEEETHFSKSPTVLFHNFFILLEDVSKKVKEEAFSSLSYEEFSNLVAKYLISPNNYCLHYDFIEGKFREDHPEIFIDKNAPSELRNGFYNRSISSSILENHEEYLPFLKEKDLSNKLENTIILNHHSLDNKVMKTYFKDEYVKRYGYEKYLSLLCRYGKCLDRMEIDIYHDEIEKEEEIEKVLQESIYKKILAGKAPNYENLSHQEDFVLKYPTLFINFENLEMDFSLKEKFTSNFYSGSMSFQDIYEYPELISFLQEKNLFCVFSEKITTYPILAELLNSIGNEEFLKLCAKYGDYFYEVASEIKKDDFSKENINTFSNKIEKEIAKKCYSGLINYQEDAPSFLKEQHPDLFLEEDAPPKLKEYFYNTRGDFPLNFEVLENHPDWLPYLEGKAYSAALLKREYLYKQMKEFLDLFEKKALSLGVNHRKTVYKMMAEDSVSTMWDWYQLSGNHFFPDYVVMKNFSLEESSKFFRSAYFWGNLMKLESYSSTESKNALLKLAYSLGLFEEGLSKKEKEEQILRPLKNILTDLPRRIDARYSYAIEMISSLNNQKWNDYSGLYNNYEKLKDTLIKEKFPVDLKEEVFSQIYQKNTDGSFSLQFNPQSYPLSAKYTRLLLEKFDEIPILSPIKMTLYFDDFDFSYNKDFRDFFLRNIDSIVSDDSLLKKISLIQKQFPNIKRNYENSNHKQLLSLDYALQYVEENRFLNVDTGNIEAAELVSKTVTNTHLNKKYNEEDWEKLQKIYNIGKQRVFSSIPRVEGQTEKYSYEILRLTDPLALVIGDLTDCCQHLEGAASSCMEHSMVSDYGRIFVVRDSNNRVVAQSWVWRNQNVLCFDNVEVPDKQMWEHGIKKGQEDSGIRNDFTDEILEVYKKASKELILKDQEVYQNLFAHKVISEEEYNNLRLSKITVGLGHSNITGSLRTLEMDDNPTKFKLVEKNLLSNNRMYTSDSNVQFVLEKEEEKIGNDQEALLLYHDSYIEYDDSNFNKNLLRLLINLEEKTTEKEKAMIPLVAEDSNHLVRDIANCYQLDSETTKIIMNPNFAIIYDIRDEKIEIADLFFNTDIKDTRPDRDSKSSVKHQILFALQQITLKYPNLTLDFWPVDDKKREMYNELLAFIPDNQIERGGRYGK